MKNQDHKDGMELVKQWYDSYRQIMIYLTTVAASLLVFSASLILREALGHRQLETAVGKCIWIFYSSWIFLFISALMGLLSYYGIYKWYSGALGRALGTLKGDIFKNNISQFTDPEQMTVWDSWSAFCAKVCGITLLIGALLFVVAVFVVAQETFSPAP